MFSIPAGLLLVFIASSVSAQFALLDRQDRETRALVDFNITPEGRGVLRDGTTLRTDLYLQYADEHWGIYAGLPISSFHGGAGAIPELDDATVFGNLELGAFGIIDVVDGLRLVPRFGFTVPTSGSGFAESALNLGGAGARYTDAPANVPEAVTLRFSVSPVLGEGVVYGRADLGIDAGFDVSGADRETFVFLRGSAGLGLDLGLIQLSIEVTNAGEVTDVLGQEFICGLGGSVHGDLGLVRVHFSYSGPLNDELRGDVHHVNLGLSAVF